MLIDSTISADETIGATRRKTVGLSSNLSRHAFEARHHANARSEQVVLVAQAKHSHASSNQSVWSVVRA